MPLSPQVIDAAVRAQLATDLNCSPGDFDREGVVFCEPADNPGRRPFPRGERHFDMLTLGGAVIVSATADIMPYLREQLDGKSRDKAFSMPFLCGQVIYYLPDDPRPLPFPKGFEFTLVERQDIPELYAHDGFHMALSYDTNALRPDVIALTAQKDGAVVGIAGASADCAMLWQIGIDVLPGYRHLGIAAALVSNLKLEILEREKVPYYGTASSNIPSQRTAHRAGLRPAWMCSWRGVFDDESTLPTC